MNTVENDVFNHLLPLVGLKLSTAWRAGGTRVFNFGDNAPHRSETERGVGYSLFVQCPWRIESADGILTGRSDIHQPVEIGANFDWAAFDFHEDGNLQDKIIAGWLGCDYERMRSPVNATDALVVETVEAAPHGGATLALTGDYRIVLFPGGRKSQWSIFRTDVEDGDFVVSGGKVEEDEGA